MPNGNLRLSRWQHIYPKNLIRNFANNDCVVIYNQNKRKSRIQKYFAKGDDFCVERLWSEKAEKGWMKEIEDSFSDICKKIKQLPYALNDHDHNKITDFYILWKLRSYTEANPSKEIKLIKDDELEDFKKGKSIPSMILMAVAAGIPKIPFPDTLNGFKALSGCMHDIKRHNSVTGNQKPWSYRVLMTPPKDDEHKKRLDSNIPWSENRENLSIDSKTWNEREAVYYINTNGYLKSDILNEIKMRISLQDYSNRYHKLRWGVLSAKCGEFIVPRGENNTCVIPISPTQALMANIKNTEITCTDIESINTSLADSQNYFFCSCLENTMLFSDVCPLKRE